MIPLLDALLATAVVLLLAGFVLTAAYVFINLDSKWEDRIRSAFFSVALAMAAVLIAAIMIVVISAPNLVEVLIP